MRKAIAIDFDGCLCDWAWPEIGAPHMEVINAAIREQENGAALILWTCREGSLLESAVEWCSSYGLEFDAVNANLPERIAAYRNDCRKVNADEYWDDHAIRKGAGREYWQNTVLVDAVQTWGAEAQQQMMIEEMSELTKALCKLYRARTEADAEAVMRMPRAFRSCCNCVNRYGCGVVGAPPVPLLMDKGQRCGFWRPTEMSFIPSEIELAGLKMYREQQENRRK